MWPLVRCLIFRVLFDGVPYNVWDDLEIIAGSSAAMKMNTKDTESSSWLTILWVSCFATSKKRAFSAKRVSVLEVSIY